MYEVSLNVDLSSKVDALSKKFDQLLALNTLPTNSPNVQGVCAICSSHSHVIYDCRSASLFPEFVQEQVNVAQGFHRQKDPYSNTYNSGWRNNPNCSWKQQRGEGQLGQQQYQQNKQPGMIAPPSFQSQRREEGRLPSHPIENPKTNYHEQAKAVITLRSRKEVDNKVGEPIKYNELNENETEEIDIETKIEKNVEKELASSSKYKTPEPSPVTSYKPKIPFPQALLPPPHLRKDNKIEDILETFKKEVKINLPLLDALSKSQRMQSFVKTCALSKENLKVMFLRKSS
ncbi:hypothetical protein M9H77_08811 [Catharanthus roseus]|uniref:Uncharacterized protein n=1 Tax=Catharanthus roseus TaxID=4058 RepID=A0ACC0BZ83_CATRO|nr:hypothetical protein M9H77_08811 [Catharanthus roseus]